jgi:hypothetical protein
MMRIVWRSIYPFNLVTEYICGWELILHHKQGGKADTSYLANYRALEALPFLIFSVWAACGPLTAWITMLPSTSNIFTAGQFKSCTCTP